MSPVETRFNRLITALPTASHSMDASVETHYPLPETLNAKQLAQIVHQLIKSKTNGMLILQSGSTTWRLFFRVGRLFWATGGDHRFRRWHRLLRLYCPEAALNGVQLREQDISMQWEHLALNVLLKRQKVSREVATALIETNLVEVLFDILQSASRIDRLTYSTDLSLFSETPIAILSATELLIKAQQQLMSWREAGLPTVSPNLAPIVKDAERLKLLIAPKAFQSLQLSLTGRYSLRDLSVNLKQDLLVLTRFLAPHIRQDLIALQPIADRAPLNNEPARAVSKPKGGSATAIAAPLKPLIICVDDSAQICHILEQIFQGAGYRFISLQDSVEALPVILKQKPDFIFLDVVMPIVHGYEICTQLRRVSMFKSTPIVILTGQDGVLDRVQAKAAGATEFITKPIDPEKVLRLVRRHMSSDVPQPEAALQR
jgi:two-component system, chemotaxis family, response regulator PixG